MGYPDGFLLALYFNINKSYYRDKNLLHITVSLRDSLFSVYLTVQKRSIEGVFEK